MSDCGGTLNPPVQYVTPRPLLEERQAFPNDGLRWPPQAVRVPYAFTEWLPLSEWQFQLGTVRLGKGEAWCPTSVEGMGLPGMRTADQPYPYAHGSVGFGDFSEPRTVNIDVTAKFSSPQQAWDELRRLTGQWQPSTRNEVLQFRMTSGDSLILFGRPRRAEADTTNIYLGIVTVALQFEALDPRFYTGHVNDLLVVAQGIPQTVCFDASTPHTGSTWDHANWDQGKWAGSPTPGAGLCMDSMCFSIAGSTFVVADNRGNVPTPVQITWNGNLDHPIVSNSATVESWEWAASSPAGELVMDSQSRLATLDGVDRYDAVTIGSQWFWLQPGQNRLNFSQNGVLPNIHVRWRDAWL